MLAQNCRRSLQHAVALRRHTVFISSASRVATHHHRGAPFKANGTRRPLSSSSTPAAATPAAPAAAAPKKNSESGGIPWGLLVFLGIIGSIGGYFWRSSKNTKLLVKLQTAIQDESALSAEEVEQIREENKLSPAHFQLLVTLVKKKFPSGQAAPSAFFKFCGTIVNPERGQLKSGYLFERLAGRLEERAATNDTRVLLAAMINAVESSVDERIEILFKLFGGGKEFMSENNLELGVQALMLTNQLPMRAMTREYSHYPYNVYAHSTAPFLATRAVEEMLKMRKKRKDLHGYEEAAATTLVARLKAADEREAIVAGGPSTKLKDSETESAADEDLGELREDLWNLDDFTDMIYSRAICAWGECEFVSQ